MKSDEQLRAKIKDGTFTKKDAKKISPWVEQFGAGPLRQYGITPEQDEDFRQSGSKIMRLLRRLILGQKSE